MEAGSKSGSGNNNSHSAGTGVQKATTAPSENSSSTIHHGIPDTSAAGGGGPHEARYDHNRSRGAYQSESETSFGDMVQNPGPTGSFFQTWRTASFQYRCSELELVKKAPVPQLDHAPRLNSAKLATKEALCLMENFLSNLNKGHLMPIEFTGFERMNEWQLNLLFKSIEMLLLILYNILFFIIVHLFHGQIFPSMFCPWSVR